MWAAPYVHGIVAVVGIVGLVACAYGCRVAARRHAAALRDEERALHTSSQTYA